MVLEGQNDQLVLKGRVHGDQQLWAKLAQMVAVNDVTNFLETSKTARELLASMPDGLLREADSTTEALRFTSDPTTKILFTYPRVVEEDPEVKKTIETAQSWQFKFNKIGIVGSFGIRPSPAISSEKEVFVCLK